MKFVLIITTLSFCLPFVVTLLFFGTIIHLLGFLIKHETMRLYGLMLMYAVDQLGNSLLMGKPDDTISMRTYKALAHGNPKWFVRPFAKFVDKLFHVLAGDRNHIADSHSEVIGQIELWSWSKN